MKDSGKEEAKQSSLGPTIESMDKAFEWLVLVQTVLIGAIFQVLTWIAKPEVDYKSVVQFMFSLTVPLMISIITWFSQLITSKKFFRLFSWGMLTMVFLYYILVFFVLVFLGITTQFSTILIVLVITTIVAVLFPSKRILNAYGTAAAENRFLKKYANFIWYAAGMLAAFILILAPFSF